MDLYFQTFARTFRQRLADAELAESVGLDGIFVEELHQRDWTTTPLLVLAALASRTTRLKLGTGVALPHLMHPIRLAEEAATVDQISEGRLILGVGIGLGQADSELYGLAARERLQRMEESLTALRIVWTDDRATYHGRSFAFDDKLARPRPYQRPHPPIWYAAWSVAGSLRAGRLADGLITGSLHNARAVRMFVDAYSGNALAAGRPPVVNLTRYVAIGRTREEATRTFGPLIRDYIREIYVGQAVDPDVDPVAADLQAGRASLDALVDKRVLFGSPEDVADQIHWWKEEIGATTVTAVLTPLDRLGSQEVIAEQLRLLGEEVKPRL